MVMADVSRALLVEAAFCAYRVPPARPSLFAWKYRRTNLYACIVPMTPLRPGHLAAKLGPNSSPNFGPNGPNPAPRAPINLTDEFKK